MKNDDKWEKQRIYGFCLFQLTCIFVQNNMYFSLLASPFEHKCSYQIKIEYTSITLDMQYNRISLYSISKKMIYIWIILGDKFNLIAKSKKKKIYILKIWIAISA